jgi:hypothetical protein
LHIVRDILSGKTLDENRWSLDGPSGCLMPSGKPGPFRTSLRWSAAVDRLSGAAERHAAACLEFRPGAGFWTVVSFTNNAARDQWQDRVKAAFRWLADSGFGGERSRGWGRADAPQFVEGMLPEMILGARNQTAKPEEVAVQGPDVTPPISEPPQEDPPAIEPPSENPDVNPPEPSPDPELPPPDPDPVPAFASSVTEEVPAPSEVAPLEQSATAAPEPQPPVPQPRVSDPHSAPQWLLSLFSPASGDSVEWSRGNYSLIERGGRVESSAGSGALKKQVRMVVEGSVLFAGSALSGAAPDVAPEGFAHPVFRAGFALAIPLPEVS